LLLLLPLNTFQIFYIYHHEIHPRHPKNREFSYTAMVGKGLMLGQPFEDDGSDNDSSYPCICYLYYLEKQV